MILYGARPSTIPAPHGVPLCGHSEHQPEPECSGHTGGEQSVPYCRYNDGGCALHYPSEQGQPQPEPEWMAEERVRKHGGSREADR